MKAELREGRVAKSWAKCQESRVPELAFERKAPVT